MRYDEPAPKTLIEALRAMNNDRLSVMVRQFCEGKAPTRKEEMVARLMTLVEADALPATVAKLQELERSALAEAAWTKDGVFDEDRFKAKYGRLPVPKAVPEPGSPVYGRRFTVSLMDLLLPAGRVPEDLRWRLRDLLPKPAPAAIKTVESPPEQVDAPVPTLGKSSRIYGDEPGPEPVARWEMERTALHDVLAVLRLVDGGKVAISEKQRWPSPGSMEQVAAVLAGGDFHPEKAPKAKEKWSIDPTAGPIRAFAWPMLLQAAKLAQVRGGRLELTKRGRAALMAAPHETIRDLWEHWLGSDGLDEMRRVNHIRGQTGGGRRGMTDPAERREKIAAALRKCPVGQWIDVNEFARYIRAAGHDFEVTRDPWRLYIAELQYGSLGYEGTDWSILQFRYLLAFLMEYAATLGVIDIACIPPDVARTDFYGLWGTDDLPYLSRYDGLLYLRLTPLGAYCLGKTEDYSPPARAAAALLKVQANLEVIAREPLPPADQMLLEAFAEKTGTTTWRLDREKALDAVAEGRDLGELAGFLEASSGEGLPPTIAPFVAGIKARATALSDRGTARLIRCADAELAKVIADDPAAGKACALLGADTLVVPAKDEATFSRAVRKLGYIIQRAGGAG